MRSSEKDFWNNRVEEIGHTGLNHPYIYPWEQKIRLVKLQKIIKEFGFKKNIKNRYLRVLDFGCGDSKFGINISKKICENFSYHCYDISEKCLFLSLKNIRAKNIKDFAIFKDIKEINKSKKNKYDLILLVTVIQHMDYSQSLNTLKRMKECLNENGIIIILDNCYNKISKVEHIRTNWDKIQVIKHLYDAGFNDIKTYKHTSNLFSITEIINLKFKSLRNNLITKYFIYLPVLLLLQSIAFFGDIFLINIFKTTYTWFVVK